MIKERLEDYVVSIPDFPEPGIQFRDITSVIQDPEGLKLAIDGLADLVRDLDFDLVIGPESRGFIFGVPVAYLLGKGFIPVRKKGKLPRETISQKYDLEYGRIGIETLGLPLELAGLEGRKKLEGYDVKSLIVYPGK